MEKRVRESFEKQQFMKYINAQLQSIEEGKVTIVCPYHPDLTQQHGFFHAGVMTSLVDVACGYAAYSMMPEGSSVLTVEFKTNFIRPANADKIVATGEVIKAGKTLTICEGQATDETGEKIFAKMMATMMRLPTEKVRKI